MRRTSREFGSVFCHPLHFVRKGLRLQEREKPERARQWEKNVLLEESGCLFLVNAPVCESLCFFLV